MVTLVTQGVKKLQTIQLSEQRRSIIRFIAAILSFGGVVGASVASGDAIDPVSVEAFVGTVLTFAVSQVIYFKLVK